MRNRNILSGDNWTTPRELYDLLDKEFDFDFDPCPLNPNFDGLEIRWGERNFVNPPYSRMLKEAFIRKSFEQSQKGRLSVMLIPVSTSSKIFHEIILPNAEIRFLKGRVKFVCIDSFSNKVNKNGVMHDSMIVIFRGIQHDL